MRTPHCYYNHIDVEASEFALMIRGRELVTDMACRSIAAALDLGVASFIP